MERMLLSWVDSKDLDSVIAKVSSIQTLSNFAKQGPLLRTRILEKFRYFAKQGGPTLKSRSKNGEENGPVRPHGRCFQNGNEDDHILK